MKEWEDPDYRHVLPDSVAIEATGGRQNRSSITYRQGLAGIGLGISYTANSGVKE
jgi:hypothetical protein